MAEHDDAITLNLMFWNVLGLSNGTTASQKRLTRVMAHAFADRPEVIGLSEVRSGGLDRVKKIAADHGYRVGHRSADEHRSHTLLLVREPVQVIDSASWWQLDPRDNSLGCEAVYAACEVPAADGTGPVRVTVASVYNYSPWPSRIAQAVQKFADDATNGHVVAGGDWNMARTLDADRELKHLGTVAFKDLRDSFGWTNVLPGPDDTEIPTYPLSRVTTSPRQLDHLFVRLPEGVTADCLVEAPPSDRPMLSDHAILRARIHARQVRLTGAC